jgi:DNA-binding transcriptional MerR regulator
MAIPRLADAIGVTPRVLRYWEEHGLISPSRERGRLRYSPRDLAIARLVKRLVDEGRSVDELRMLRDLSQREVRLLPFERTDLLSEVALGILYARKAFAEVTGSSEEHYPEGPPPAPGPPKNRPRRGPKGGPPR